MLDQQRVAAHFFVVVHAVIGVLLRKGSPVAALAEQQQPVVAQAVFHISAGVGAIKRLHFLARSFWQARFQFPIRGVTFKRVAFGLGQ